MLSLIIYVQRSHTQPTIIALEQQELEDFMSLVRSGSLVNKPSQWLGLCFGTPLMIIPECLIPLHHLCPD
jgi:hypothetical protein